MPVFSYLPFLFQGKEMTDQLKAQCPSCQRECNTEVIGKKEQTWNQDFEGISVYGEVDHRLLECCGCNTIFYYRRSWDTEGTSHDSIDYEIVTFPAPKSSSPEPEWLDQLYLKDKRLYRILKEIYGAYERESYILASIGLRTAFDSATEALDVDPGLPMTKKVELVFDKGYIGIAERKQLMIVIEAGNAAAHRAWNPDENEFRQLLKVLENFIHRAVLDPNDLQSLENSIPKKQKKGYTVNEGEFKK